MSDPATVTRAEFINRMVQDGLTYHQAVIAYGSFIRTLEDGICEGSRITFGRVGALNVVKLAPRTVPMGFDRTGGKVRKRKRVYFLGSRFKYKWTLFPKFRERVQLKWQI